MIKNRNLSHERQTLKPGPDMSSVATDEDREGEAKPLRSDLVTEPVLMGDVNLTGVTTGEKNRNCINYERQQAQSRYFGSDDNTPIGLSEPVPAVCIGGPLRAQLTQEDLETPKLDLSEVQRNLRESSDESLMEHSQKQFSSSETTIPFYPLVEMSTEGSRHSDTPASVLPKQQNVPKRPSTLSLNTKSAGKLSSSSSASSLRMKFGKLAKSNLKKVDVGVARAKSAPGPRPVVVVTNNAVSSIMANLSGGSGHVPPAGTVNPTESQVRENVEELTFGFLTASPDEQEPLLRRDAQLDSNTNNNNSNNNGDGNGDGEGEGAGGETGETNENTASAGEPQISSITEPPALPPLCQSAPPLAATEAGTFARPQGEALLRQNRVRRPERPNSLDLSITTHPFLGKFTSVSLTRFNMRYIENTCRHLPMSNTTLYKRKL